MNCRGCGVQLDPSQEQVSTTVEEILETSLKDAEKKGGVCPLCGHSKEIPYSHRKNVLFGLLLACLLASVVVGIGVERSRRTDRAALAGEAVARMGTNAEVVRLIGKPITIERGLQGEIKQDETGWKEAHLTIPVRGPHGDATAHVVGGKGTGPWAFTTFEIDFEKQHEKVDLVSGRGTYLPLIEAYTLKGLGDKAISARRPYYAATRDSELDEAMGKEFVLGRFSGAIKAEIAIMLARMQTKHVSKIEVAIRYAQVKDRNQTIIWLERAFSEQEDVVDWINDPIFDFLGDDARFNALLRRMNLPWARS